jgi:hypothetical protein
MRLTWVFARTDGALNVAYNNPIAAFDQPTSPAVGDYWFDLSAMIWKTFNGSSFVDATAILVGVCAQDTAGCKWARSFDVFNLFDALNTLTIERIDNNTLRSVEPNARVSVYGSKIDFGPDLQEWEMSGDLESGFSEAASTNYYAYITQAGDTILSPERPFVRDDILGRYHPFNSWRCIGQTFNSATSNFDAGSVTNEGGHGKRRIRAEEVERVSGGTTANAGQVAISSSCNGYSSNSGTSVLVTNLSVNLTTTGKPVQLFLTPDGTTNDSYIGATGAPSAAVFIDLFFYRDNVQISATNLRVQHTGADIILIRIPPCMGYLDFPNAGVHKYQVFHRVIQGLSTDLGFMKLVAYEL